ncbi:MAG: MerR family transcriptional regulator [Acidimicrobiales bacterium]|nr:MerR family transcriptional regulator [Hyphomonadaceae bacterium]RZV44320.1 MAG: MerR family transcriptional regulator [Acidimicrobiales bacterium]
MLKAPYSSDTKDISPTDDEVWGIAELAAHFEITTRAIRFYEDKGLLTPKRENGSRVFSQSDRDRMERILRAKRLGFSLEDIRAVQEVADGEVTDREELLNRKQNFEKVIKNLRRRRRDADILSKQMQALCAAIDDYAEQAPKSSVFQYAEAYEALFRKQLDEDFSPF